MGGGWTSEAVEERLVAAFRALPGRPVLGRGHALRHADGSVDAMTQALGWGRLYLQADPGARHHLYAWARSRALGDSFSAYCIEAGWPRSSAEAGRRRGAAAIAAALNR